jgi:hypothetical protein
MRSPVRLPAIAFVALLPLIVTACGGDGGSPTSPSSSSSSSTPTRVIAVNGNLAFGDVPVGSSRDLTYTISNTGTAALTVSGTTISGGLASQTTFSFTTGTVPAGATQTVTVRFQPTTAGSYSGTISVNGDQTSGANTVAISGTATAPAAQGTWSGRYDVQRCDGTGSNQDYFCSTNRGAYPPGSSLPLTLMLTQTGTSVRGTIALGQVTGSVSGTVDAVGNLSLQGTASSGQINLAVTTFSASISGSSMSGTMTYAAGLAGVPGVAVVTSRLSGVTRR